MARVEVKDLSIDYTLTRSGARLTALDQANLVVNEGEFVTIVGPSGCGKTTLLHAIASLVHPTVGEVRFSGWKDRKTPRRRMVFQDQGLFPWLTVMDNVGFGLEMEGVNKEDRSVSSRQFLTKMGMWQFAGSYPHELSGGMRQRVALARAFVSNPDILLLDEPFRALDAQTRLVLQEELLRIWYESHKTIIFVTHDIEEAIMLGDRVIVMSGRPGTIREDIRINLPRPRDLTGMVDQESRDIKWHIWKMLEQEVRQNLVQQ